MTVELYRWLGAAVNGYLSDLKPVQQKDLEEAFSKLPNEKATPERLLRSEQAAAAEAAATNEVDMGNIYIYTQCFTFLFLFSVYINNLSLLLLIKII